MERFNAQTFYQLTNELGVKTVVTNGNDRAKYVWTSFGKLHSRPSGSDCAPEQKLNTVARANQFIETGTMKNWLGLPPFMQNWQ